MPITRAKASSLLNQGEMALYDDSRINGLRQLDARALASRIRRARTARDRARDLVQKQKLASRAKTGSKRGTSGQANQRSQDKVELMADILERFERRLGEVEREDTGATSTTSRPSRKAAKKKAAGAASTARSGSANGAKRAKQSAKGAATPSRATKTKTASKALKAAKASKDKAASTTRTSKTSKSSKTSKTSKTAKATKATKTTRATKAKQDAAANSAATPSRARSAGNGAAAPAAPRTRTSRPANGKATATAAKSTRGRGARSPRKRHITPEQALAQTQALLEAKQEQAAAPKPWQDAPGGGVAAGGQPGYQSDAARRRALRLHEAEARIPAIHGSVSTRDRINQGKRDRRGDDNGD